MCNFAEKSWAQNFNVVYVSTEMDHIQIYERVLCAHFNVSNYKDVGVVSLKLPWPQAHIKVIKVGPLEANTNDIIEKVKELPWKPSVIYIDYMDELRGTERSISEYSGLYCTTYS